MLLWHLHLDAVLPSMTATVENLCKNTRPKTCPSNLKQWKEIIFKWWRLTRFQKKKDFSTKLFCLLVFYFENQALRSYFLRNGGSRRRWPPLLKLKLPRFSYGFNANFVKAHVLAWLIDFEDSGKISVPGENANLQRFHRFMCAPR